MPDWETNSGNDTSRVAMRPRRGLTRTEHIFHTVAALGFVIAAVTGFGADYAFGEVCGWMLFVHVLAGPPFIIGLTGVTLMWAQRCMPGRRDPHFVNLTAGQKAAFWFGVVLGFATVLPMLLATLPIFGYRSQHTLVEIHELSAILLLVTMIVHTFISLAARRQRGRSR